MSFPVTMAIGFVFMVSFGLLLNTETKYPVWKMLIAFTAFGIVGYLGIKLMFFIETGGWSGRSYFGAVLIAPLLMYPVSLLLKFPYPQMLDSTVPTAAMFSAIIKIDCLIEGCCRGIVLKTLEDGSYIRFPSQMAEFTANLIIMGVLIKMHRSRKYQGLIYPWYLVIYGAVRFILNLFRETVPFVWILPAGNFWSLIAILIGGTVLLLHKAKAEQQRAKKKKPRRT